MDSTCQNSAKMSKDNHSQALANLYLLEIQNFTI